MSNFAVLDDNIIMKVFLYLTVEKSKFIELTINERDKLDLIVKLVRSKGDELANLNEIWTIKDTIAHIGWYEAEMINLIESKSMKSNVELWSTPLNKRNKIIDELNNRKSIEEVFSEYQKNGQRLIRLLEELPPELYSNPSYFDEMPSEWKPYIVFQENTFLHYRGHIKQLVKTLPYVAEFMDRSKMIDE